MDFKFFRYAVSIKRKKTQTEFFSEQMPTPPIEEMDDAQLHLELSTGHRFYGGPTKRLYRILCRIIRGGEIAPQFAVFRGAIERELDRRRLQWTLWIALVAAGASVTGVVTTWALHFWTETKQSRAQVEALQIQVSALQIALDDLRKTTKLEAPQSPNILRERIPKSEQPATTPSSFPPSSISQPLPSPQATLPADSQKQPK